MKQNKSSLLKSDAGFWYEAKSKHKKAKYSMKQNKSSLLKSGAGFCYEAISKHKKTKYSMKQNNSSIPQIECRIVV